MQNSSPSHYPDVLQVSHSEEGFTFSDSYAQDEPVAAVRDPRLILTTKRAFKQISHKLGMVSDESANSSSNTTTDFLITTRTLMISVQTKSKACTSQLSLSEEQPSHIDGISAGAEEY